MFKYISFQIFDRLFTVVFFILCDSLLARTVSVNEYGYWQYAMNVSLLVYSFCLLISSEIVVPVLVKNKRIVNEVLTSVIIIRLLIFVLCMSVASIYVDFFNISGLQRELFFSFVFILCVNEIASTSTNYSLAILNVKYTTIANVLSLVIRAVLYFIAYRSGEGINSFINARFMEAIIFLTLMLYMLVLFNVKFSFSSYITKIIFFRGLKFWFGIFLTYLYTRIDRFFVEHQLNTEVLAYYAVSVQLIEQVRAFSLILIKSMFSKYIFVKQSVNNLYSRVNNLIFFVLIFSFVSCFMVWMLSGLFIEIIYSKKYISSVQMLDTMSLSVIFIMLDIVFLQFLIRQRMSKFIFIKALVLSLCAIYIYGFQLDLLGEDYLAYLYNVFNFLALSISFVFYLLTKRYYVGRRLPSKK
ncbi:oligosaccharide flippase family protein [Vibrio sp. B172a]|uniref:oligosaccharide flippase family protein n=1 Tax=Vibrio sp. B172a TaxID=2835790 RepID=UPI00358E1DA1